MPTPRPPRVYIAFSREEWAVIKLALTVAAREWHINEDAAGEANRLADVIREGANFPPRATEHT